ncbi:MAG: bifunctional UDP-N-acetylglucosamine diphosphorylase/glucosamine-1-phosphate N-acetyltransferase GlmU [Clostridiales bacterium]|nr:bifunctional UDP-N-acetylglucosamine diphosphorylase/glucosamine-1-phosphate N-acetyltransferase GlmU [Clostridiales bacterium]
MDENCTLILAAGEGTRMRSSKPKVLAEVLFKPMIDWVTDCVQRCGVKKENICVVTGHMKEMLTEHLEKGISTVYQEERLGTGHAVMQAKDFIEAHGHADILILCGDAPLIDDGTVLSAYEYHKRTGNAATVISANVADPYGYGRIVRDKSGIFSKIVEERDADEEIKKINEVNSGAYWFSCRALLIALDKLGTDAKYRLGSAAKEYYLTDAIEILRDMGQKTATFNTKNSNVVLGANDRIQLEDLNNIARRGVLESLMKSGVSIPCADGIMIGPDVKIGADTVILPGTIIKGRTEIGSNCTIGPQSFIENGKFGNNVSFMNSYCNDAEVWSGAEIGPFARLRPDSRIGENVRVGNFVEVKNSIVESGTKISHLSYIGDSDVGCNVNIGSGCATVNYSGKEKHRTVIENGAFIGCDTNLVAPVKVGENAYTAAGSTITEDVPANALALARERQIIKKDWVKVKKPYKRQG